MADKQPVPPPSPSDWKRAWDKINKTPSCWEWTAGTFTAGYGAFSLHGESRRAHRVIYVWTHGEVPDGMELDHVCGNKRCVRPHPDHVWPKPQRENVLRSTGPTARNARKTQSDSGHDLDYVDPRGWRGSKVDRAAASRRYYDRNREVVNAKKRASRIKVVYDERPCAHCGRPFRPDRSTGMMCRRRDCINSRQRENRRKRLEES